VRNTSACMVLLFCAALYRYDIIRNVDTDGNGGISFFEFKQTFMAGQAGGLDEDAGSAVFEPFTVTQWV
jgi:hypothetical protein